MPAEGVQKSKGKKAEKRRMVMVIQLTAATRHSDKRAAPYQGTPLDPATGSAGWRGLGKRDEAGEALFTCCFLCLKDAVRSGWICAAGTGRDSKFPDRERRFDAQAGRGGKGNEGKEGE